MVLALLGGTGVAAGQQRLEFDVKGGLAVTDQIRWSQDESKRYLIGGGVEARIYRGFAVEGNFLYRRLGQRTAFQFNPFPPAGTEGPVEVRSDSRVRYDVIEVPVLGKYYFRHDKKVRPFVSTGYSFRKILVGTDFEVRQRFADGRVQNDKGRNSSWRGLDIGATVGLGVAWHVGRIAVVPEFRYTRWGGEPTAPVHKQQVDFILGIRF